jgi:hypothetical protein
MVQRVGQNRSYLLIYLLQVLLLLLLLLLLLQSLLVRPGVLDVALPGALCPCCEEHCGGRLFWQRRRHGNAHWLRFLSDILRVKLERSQRHVRTLVLQKLDGCFQIGAGRAVDGCPPMPILHINETTFPISGQPFGRIVQPCVRCKMEG